MSSFGTQKRFLHVTEDERLFSTNEINLENAYVLFYVKKSKVVEYEMPPQKTEIPQQLNTDLIKFRRINEFAARKNSKKYFNLITMDTLFEWSGCGLLSKFNRFESEMPLDFNTKRRIRVYFKSKPTVSAVYKHLYKLLRPCEENRRDFLSRSLIYHSLLKSDSSL